MLIIMIRTVILYVIVIAALRLMGKKQLGELQPSELVTTILVSNIATMSIEDPSLPMLLGTVPIFMIVGIDVLMSVLMLRHAGFRRIVTGCPRVIISGGRIDQRELRRLRYTIDDVLESMREQGIFDINDVRYAIVETTGKINFFSRSDGDGDPPCVIVRDGFSASEGMRQAGIDEKELSELLEKENIRLGDVFLLTMTKDRGYTLIPRDGSGEKKEGEQ